MTDGLWIGPATAVTDGEVIDLMDATPDALHYTPICGHPGIAAVELTDTRTLRVHTTDGATLTWTRTHGQVSVYAVLIYLPHQADVPPVTVHVHPDAASALDDIATDTENLAHYLTHRGSRNTDLERLVTSTAEIAREYGDHTGAARRDGDPPPQWHGGPFLLPDGSCWRTDRLDGREALDLLRWIQARNSSV